MSRFDCCLLLFIATAIAAIAGATNDTALTNTATIADTDKHNDGWSIEEIQEDFLRVVKAKEGNKVPWRGLRGSVSSQQLVRQPVIAQEIAKEDARDIAQEVFVATIDEVISAAASPRALSNNQNIVPNTQPHAHHHHHHQRVLTDSNTVAVAAHVLESVPMSPSIFSSLFSLGLYYLGGTTATTTSSSQPTAQPSPLPMTNQPVSQPSAQPSSSPSSWTESVGDDIYYSVYYADNYLDDVVTDDTTNPSPCLYNTCYGYTCDHFVSRIQVRPVDHEQFCNLKMAIFSSN